MMSRVTAAKRCHCKLRQGEKKKAMAALRDCMNLKMAKAEDDCSLNTPPSIDVIWVLKQASEKPRRNAMNIIRYLLGSMKANSSVSLRLAEFGMAKKVRK